MTVPHPPYSPDLAPCDFCLFPKLRGCRYGTTEEMKEAVTKVIDTLTQKDFHGAFQKLLERCNRCIVAGGDYFEGDYSFMCVISIKLPTRKKSGNLFNDMRTFTFGFIPLGKVWTPLFSQLCVKEYHYFLLQGGFGIKWPKKVDMPLKTEALDVDKIVLC